MDDNVDEVDGLMGVTQKQLVRQMKYEINGLR